MTVTAQNSRLDDAEALTDWTGITKSASLENNFNYQNTYCVANDKGATGVYGAELDDGVTTNLSSGTYDTVIFKLFTFGPGLIDTKDQAGMAARIGSDSSNYYEYYIHGSDTYPSTSSWLIVPINPNLAAYRAGTTGSPALGSADYYAGTINATASAKIGAFGIDAVDVGSGLTFTGTGGSYQDFVDYDEGTSTNRFGYVTTISGVIYVVGTLIVKPDASGTFSASNKTIIYPTGLYDAGFAGHEVDLTNTSTVTISSVTYVGAGTGTIIQDFHTTNDVDGTNEEVDITGHGFVTGDYVGYSKQGGTASMGLTDATNYWVNAVTDDSIAFYTTLANALADTSRVNLTASGTETHRLTKVQDQRPDFVVSGTSGSATFDGNSYLNHRNVTFTSAASQDGGRIECKLLTQASADIENVTIVTSAAPSEACLQDPTFGTTTDLHDVTFEQGSLGEVGHALEIDTATSYTLTNIFFNGYGATTSDQAAIDVTATSGTVTLNISGGDTPTYKTAGATVVISADPTSVTAKVTTETGVDIQSANVFVATTATATGGLPYEQAITSITRSGTTATVTFTADHNLATNDKIFLEGITDKIEDNNKAFTVTYSSDTVVTYTTTDSGSTNYTGTIVGTFIVLKGLTDVNGEISLSRVFPANQSIGGWARKSTSAPYYKQGAMSGAISTTSDVTLNAVLVED